MNYVVIGVGEPSPLDKEHIVNSMFKAAMYGNRIYFCDNTPLYETAYSAAKSWKELNDFKVELIRVRSIDGSYEDNLPSIIDCILYFINEEANNDAIFVAQQELLAEEGIRAERYILGTWDKSE